MAEYKPLNNLAYEYLRNMIYNCDLAFGVIYSETKLASQISVSRTPMRDALNRLAQERYIDILPNRGFTLHAPTPDEITQAGHIRLMIECYCADIVARAYPAPEARAAVARMQDALRQQQRLLESDAEYSLSAFWRDDLRFHEELLIYLRVSAIMEPYEGVMHIFMPHYLIRSPRLRERDDAVMLRHRSTLTEHAEILDALQASDPFRVQTAIRAHVASSLNALNAQQHP